MDALSVREAALKYALPETTLRQWVNDGMVRVITKPARPGSPKMIAEADVKKLADNYTPGAGRGKRAKLRAACVN